MINLILDPILIFGKFGFEPHGLMGAGGTGPRLLRPFLPRATEDVALTAVVQNGIPGTGMPGASLLE